MDLTQNSVKPPVPPPATRRMVRAELLGNHSHVTPSGAAVHIWEREGSYIARGRVNRSSFGETLGRDLKTAGARLHKLITELEDQTYVRASVARKRSLPHQKPNRLTLRGLLSEYLEEKRQINGRKTARTYRGRLAHVLAFAEQNKNLRVWPLARDINRQFALALRSSLFEQQTTANGRPGGKKRTLSPRQIYNILDATRSLFNWGKKPCISKLPLDWANPLKEDIVGERPRKDPLRDAKFQLVSAEPLIIKMNQWQLCQLGLMFVLAPRPDEFVGILVSDVDFTKKHISFGTRFGGNDFNKSHQSFVVPFPPEVEPLLRTLVGGRTEGPLLRGKTEFARPLRSSFHSLKELTTDFDEYLGKLPGQTVHSAQDRKAAFRSFLKDRGGVASDVLSREFKKCLRELPDSSRVTLYDLRHSVTQAMKDSGMAHLDLRYLTSHATNDILNEYTSIDVQKTMATFYKTIPGVLNALRLRSIEVGCMRQC